jgi:drug/metabolite transporter (DMT)-like permease
VTARTIDSQLFNLTSAIELVFLASLWGASFLLLRIAAPVFGPVLLIELRVLTGLLVTLPFLFLYKQQNELFRHWKIIAFISMTNMCLPFCLLAFASLSLGAGMISIINATVPFFAAMLGVIFFTQIMGLAAILGLVVGFVGVLALILGNDGGVTFTGSLIAFSAGLAAAASYGFSANVIDKKLVGVNGLAITVGSLFFSTVYLLPFVLLFPPEQLPTGSIWLVVFVFGAFCTGLAYVLFYRLIKKVGAYRTLTVTYLVPLFSIGYGVAFLAESLTVAMMVGCILVLAGVAITTGRVPGLR